MAPRQRKNPVLAFFHHLVDFKVEDIFTRKRAPPPKRQIFVNEDLPPEAYEKGKLKKSWIYITNQVVTSKYTIITFVPRNLLEQFRRVANIFFAFIAILQFLPEFSTISPGLVLLPLIVVILISAGKDGYEDVKRHNSDRAVNHSKTLVLHGGGWVNPNVTGRKTKTFTLGITKRKGDKVHHEEADPEKQGSTNGSPPAVVVSEHNSDQPDDSMYMHHHHHDDNAEPHWRHKLWEDIGVGDFVLLRADESIPADILIMATSEEENVAFVETKNLDGETNLKSRHGVQELSHLRTPPDLLKAAFSVEVEAPHPNMFQFNGAVVLKDGETKFPIDLQTVLLRGTVLRNTRWVVGIVLYTGQDSKIVMNSGLTPSKRSKVERQMNPQVFVNLLMLAVMATVCAIVDSVLETSWFEDGAPWEYGADRSDDNPRINGVITFANALITFQNVVPISLYVSIEFVRTCQAAFIYFDGDIWYEKTNTATLARSWNLSDDLGQIEYIFSDKTGTLTQNAMVFRQCSVGGKIYKGDDAPEEDAQPQAKQDEDTTTFNDSTPGQSPEQRPKDVLVTAESVSSTTAAPLGTPKLSPHIAFSDATLQADLQAGDPNHTRSLNGFFATLALCHSVLASQDPETGVITYKAQSPDESALVQAAADVGFIFRGREKEIMRLQTPFSDHLEEYELLNLLDFTSARKRMSVIVRKLEENDNRIFLLSKGADNVIFERLKPGQGSEELKTKTGQDLDYFASEGLRTLCLAYKVIPDDEYATWAEKYHAATVALEDRDEKIEAASDEMERGLRLLGATAIEDKLQDGVPDTIADLKRAGIKIWVATGDKLETAIAIGHSTNLIARDSNLIVVRGGDSGGSRSAYSQMLVAVEQFFPDSEILDSEDIYPPEGDERHPNNRSERHSLRRMATGNSSLVGDENGNRPGGYVLVIDGSALGHALEEDFSKSLLLQLATRCEAVICCRVSPRQKAEIVNLVKKGLGVMTLAIGDGANDVSMIQAADVGVGISGEEGLQAVNSSDYAIAQFRFLKRLLLVHGHWSYARNGNMIVNFFYKNIVCIGVLWWFQIYCGWSTTYVFDYTYLLFWNVFWSLAPVIAIGIFDRNIDGDILMKVPELYRYGREGRYFGLKLFSLYMMDGIVQSAIIFFFTFYAYYTTTARSDGYEVWMFEFSATMVIISVMVVNAFNGLNTSAWTGWVWFSVSIGIILVWAYTAIYSVVAPGWFRTDAYGNYIFLFTSAYFWLCIPLAFTLSMMPKYLAKAYKFIYMPDDIDILRWVRKVDPDHDFDNDPMVGGRLKPGTFWSQLSPVSSRMSDDRHSEPAPRRSLQGRQSMDARGSQVDMSTGRPLVSRGFSFSIEEGGVAMRRVQSRLSERHQSRVSLPAAIAEELVPKKRRGSVSLFPTLKKTMKLKRTPSPTQGDPPPSPPR